MVLRSPWSIRVLTLALKYVSRGCAPRTIVLNGKWAVPGVGYGESIDAIAKEVIG